MTETSDDRIARYKRLAAGARSKAGRIEDVKVRETLLQIAASWEQLAKLEAELAERRLRQSGSN